MPTTYAIPNGRTVMDASLYTGNNTTNVITNTAGFKPDLVWIKGRGNTGQNTLQNSVTLPTHYLISNAQAAEGTDGSLTSFNTNGFNLTTDAGVSYNANGVSYVGWQWQAGQGTTSSNTNGSITSTVSVNANAGFSVVTYTGTGSAATVGHGLGVKPSLVIVKRRDFADDWRVWHTAFTGSQYIDLNSTNAVASAASVWNSTEPTSSLLSIGTSNSVNANGGTYVAYCWAEVAGFSKFGSYTGNGISDGPFVYTGFRPKFVMTKRTDSSSGGNWTIIDSARNPYNVTNLRLYADTSDAESSSNTVDDLVSNGFKVRQGDGSTNNINGANYIYMAFAENPFKYANAR